MKPIPYDPDRMQIAAAAFDRAWRDFESARGDLYRYVLTPAYRPEHFVDPAERRDHELTADKFWAKITGLPPLTSPEHLEIVNAAAIRETGAATREACRRAALIWSLRRGMIDPRRIFWICDDCLARCHPGEMPLPGTLMTYATCPVCGRPTDDRRKFTPIFAKDIRTPPITITAETIEQSPIDLTRFPNR